MHISKQINIYIYTVYIYIYAYVYIPFVYIPLAHAAAMLSLPQASESFASDASNEAVALAEKCGHHDANLCDKLSGAWTIH